MRKIFLLMILLLIVLTGCKNKEEDDMILPNVNFKEIDVDQERTRNLKKDLDEKKETKVIEDDDDDDTKEQDLFNLIDSMYQKEGQDE